MATMSMPMSFGFDGGNAGYQQMMSRVATATGQLMTSTVNQQENTFYQAVRKTQDFCDITTLVVGDYGRNKALDAYRGMNLARGSATSDYISSLNRMDVPSFQAKISHTDSTGKVVTSTGNFNMNNFSANTLASLRQTGSATVGSTTYTVSDHGKFQKEMSAYDKKFDYDRQLQGSVSRSDQISSMKNLYQSAAKHMDGNANLKSIQDAINSGKGTEHVKRAANRVDRDLTDKIRNCSSRASSTLVSQLNRIERTGTLNNTQKESLFADIDREAHLSDTDKSMLKQLLDSRNEERNLISSGLVEAGGINAGRNALYAGRRIVMRNLMGPDFYQFYAMAKTGVAIAKCTTRIVRGTMMNARIKHYDRLIKVSPVADRMTQRVYNRAMGFAPGTHSSHVTNHLIQKREQIIDQKQFVDSLRGKSYHEKIALKRGRKESILDAKSSLKRKKLVERRDRAARSGNRRRADRIDRRREALDRRSQRRFDRRSRRHARTDRVNAIKEKFRNIGQKLLKPIRIVAAPIQWIVNLPRMIAQKIATYVLIPVAMFILKYMIGIPIGILLAVYFVSSFFSNIVPDISNLATKWASDRVAQLNDQNYFQYIVDTAGDDIAQDFFEIANKEAFDYFSKKNLQQSQILASHDKADPDFKSNISTKWYAGVNYGEVGHVWVWEEADNITTYDETDGHHTKGSRVFTKDGYSFVDSEDYPGYLTIQKRISQNRSLDNVHANMVPILSMLKQRYFGEINFQTYPTALGYFYYMYAMSHDISRYDTSLKPTSGNEVVVGDVHYTEKSQDKLGFGYRIEAPCPRCALYSAKLGWDSGAKQVTGRENESCTNIYIHGDKTSLSKRHVNKGLGLHLFQTNEEAMQKTIKENFPSKHTGDQAGSWWIIDDSKDPSTVPASKEASFLSGSYEDSAGMVTFRGGACTHVGIGKYDENCTQCGKIEHKEHTSACCQDAYENCTGELNTDMDQDGTNDTHTHTEACSGGLDKSTCIYIKTNGGDGLHEHEWNESDGGCYVRVAYCKGHCGGHITPITDIVQMMTYQGLARLDDFKTTHYLTTEEVLGQDLTSVINLTDAIRKRFMADADSRFATVHRWRMYWYTEAVKWYTPMPRSIWGLGSTLWNKALAFAAEPPNEAELNKEAGKNDVELFTGWYDKKTNEMDKTWLSTLYHMYGSYYKPKEFKKSSGENMGDEKYITAQKMWSEPIIAKDWAVKFPSISVSELRRQVMMKQIPEEFRNYMPPGEYMDDETFKAMIEEIDSWLGTPYLMVHPCVKGVHADCSGFVSCVFAAIGKMAPGQYYDTELFHKNAAYVSESELRPGDIILFKDTYPSGKLDGVSHVGIVIDPVNKIMAHSGKPMQYASYDTPYWRQKFLRYGRM